MRFCSQLFYTNNNIFFILKLCSGLVVSGYSKSPLIEVNTKLSAIVEPYKKFKQNYHVGPSHEFKGKFIIKIIFSKI